MHKESQFFVLIKNIGTKGEKVQSLEDDPVQLGSSFFRTSKRSISQERRVDGGTEEFKYISFLLDHPFLNRHNSLLYSNFGSK